MRWATLTCFMSFLVILFTNFFPHPAFAADFYVLQQDFLQLQTVINQAIIEQQKNANYTWKIVASALILLMQLGFLALEAGIARSKNSINVAQKNITDFIVAACSFYIIGFAFMFGGGSFPWVGWDTNLTLWSGFDDDWHYSFFIFQTMFVGTAATIASGAVAERMKFSAYIVMSILVSVLIYPIYGHWAWGNLLTPTTTAFLADRGFIDFAGSSVVHTIGASVGLAAVLILGPRRGKFNQDGSVNHIHGHSMVLASVGAAVLWLGWIGFNGGSANIHSPGFTRIVANTILALAFGGITALIIGRIKEKLYLPIYTINGTLGGLVGITAGCDSLAPHSAVLVGIICGIIVIMSLRFFEHVLKIDDVVGAISVHGTCGVVGTLLAGAFAMENKLKAGSRIDQIIIQLEGALIAVAWGFLVSYIFLGLYHRYIGIRISQQQEEQGLNSVEHGASLGTGILQEHLLHAIEGQYDPTLPLDEETGDEAAELAVMFNPFLRKINYLVNNISQHAQRLYSTSEKFHDLATTFSEGANHLTTHTDLANTSVTSVTKHTEIAATISQEMHQKVINISESAMHMALDMDKVSNAIDQITNSINEISVNAKNANLVANEATELSHSAIKTVQSLGDATDQIDDVVTLIKSIARQVHLLSLNATIEAMKAGESGQGFTVVAQEVKNLAKQTAKATNEIKEKIEKIQKDSTASIDVIHSISDVIGTIGSSVNTITHSVEKQNIEAKKISNQINITTDKAKEMVESVKEVSDGAEKIASNHSLTSDQMEKLNHNLTKLSGEANSRCETSKIIEQSSHELAQMAETVEKYSKTFKVKKKDKDTITPPSSASEISDTDDEKKN